ncbi:MAG: ATP-binding protein [Candidatus Muiribacteriota bacterium]
MYVNNLQIKNYRNYKNKNIKFERGLNLINGFNDSGKSSIFSALQELLLFDYNVYRKNFHNLSLPYYLKAEIFLNNKKIWLEKNAEIGEFYLITDDKKVEKDKAFDVFCSMLNININRSVFGALYFFKQRDWIYYFEKGKNIKSISEIIKQYISTGDLKVESDITAKLKNAKKYWQSQKEKLSESLDKSQKELSVVQSFVIERETGLNVLAKNRRKLKKIKKNIDKKSFMFKAIKDYSKLKEEFEDFSSETQKFKTKLQKIENLENKKGYLQKKVENLKFFTLEKFEEISSISGLVQNKNKDLLEKKYDNTVSNLLVYKNLSNIFGILMFLFSGLGFFISPYFFFFIIGAGILFFLSYYFKEKISEQQHKEQMDIQTNYSRDVQSINNKLTRILDSANVSNVDEYKEKYHSKEELQKNLEKVKNELKNLLEDSSFEELQKHYDNLLHRQEDLKSKLSELKKQNHDKDKDIEIELIKSEIENMYEKKEKVEDNIKKIKLTLNKNKYFCEDFFELEERVNFEKKSLQKVEEEIDSLSMIEDFIKRAHMDLMENANSILDMTIDKYFIYITAWEYQDVKVEFTDKNKLEFRVYSKKNDSYISDKILGESTLDQLYIAFRLAMIELIDEDGIYPVFLDETFSYFDSKRLKSTCRLFENIASNRQVCYFNGSESVLNYYKEAEEKVNIINL